MVTVSLTLLHSERPKSFGHSECNRVNSTRIMHCSISLISEVFHVKKKSELPLNSPLIQSLLSQPDLVHNQVSVKPA